MGNGESYCTLGFQEEEVKIFVIQTVEGKIVHDFSFTLLESIRYQNWANNTWTEKIYDVLLTNIVPKNLYKNFISDYIPIGTVEFVSEFLDFYYGKVPKPINIPDELNYPRFTGRDVEVVSTKDQIHQGKWFIKSMDKIKHFTDIVEIPKDLPIIPDGSYQFSKIVDFISEWRVFVYNKKMVGLQNYLGDFTIFPNVFAILNMIEGYESSPISYTLDVGVILDNTSVETSIIEVHDFFSCGFYGFADHKIIPRMFIDWYREFTTGS